MYLWLHIQSLVDIVCVLVWGVHARLVTNVKLPEDDIQKSKHVEVYIL